MIHDSLFFSSVYSPELVVSLEASNEFLKERVINLPQSKVEGTHNTEEGCRYQI